MRSSASSTACSLHFVLETSQESQKPDMSGRKRFRLCPTSMRRALLELSQQASSCDSRRPAISSGRPHGFGHIPSSLRSFEHIRQRRKAHLKSLPSKGRFCYCHLSVGLDRKSTRLNSSHLGISY